MAVGNSINEATTGITGFTGTAFVGSPATQHTVQIGGATTSTLVSVTNGTTGQVFTANTGAAPTWQTPGGGTFVKQVRTQTNTSTGLNSFVLTNSAPGNTEGTEVLTVSITPANSANILVIEGMIQFTAVGAITGEVIAALFQDSGASAIFTAFAGLDQTNVSPMFPWDTKLPFQYYMTAGTTSATTFKIRAGGYGASTLNLTMAGTNFGGTIYSTLIVSEYTA